MTTALNKPVKRRTTETRRDRSKHRRIVITLYPGHDKGAIIGFRLEGCRSEEKIFVQTAYEYAIRLRVSSERLAKWKAREAKKKGRA